MKLLMLWRRRSEYYEYFYNHYPEAREMKWTQHLALLNQNSVSWPSAICDHMRSEGIEATRVLVDDFNLQSKWVEEAGVDVPSNCTPGDSAWQQQVAYKQVKAIRPDVLMLGTMFDFYGDFVVAAKEYCPRIVTWMGSPFEDTIDVRGIGALLTENPSTLAGCQDAFEKVIVTKPGFPKKAVTRLGEVEKTRQTVFVGGLSRSHSHRVSVLATLVRRGFEIDLWGYMEEVVSCSVGQIGVQLLKALSERSLWKVRWLLRHEFSKRRFASNLNLLKPRHYGPVFDLDMLQAIAAAQISLNVHIDVAGNNAGNMRMVESTGAGTCLVTERSSNISELFVPEKEVVTYDSLSELCERIQYLLDHPAETAQIAKAGQNRTLKEHTIERMFEDIKRAF